MKKYRIRKFSPLWLFTRGAGVVLTLAGAYACILMAYALTLSF